MSYKGFSSPCVNSMQQLHGRRRPAGSPAYHVHLDQQHTQGKGLPQALQPFMDVVWMEVVVAEAGRDREGQVEGLSVPEAPGILMYLTGMHGKGDNTARGPGKSTNRDDFKEGS